MMSTIEGMTDRHQAPSYPLRMPIDLKEKVATAAKASGRSMHAEIVARLQASFPPSIETSPGEPLGSTAEASAKRQSWREIWLQQELQRTQLQAKYEALVSQVFSLQSQGMTVRQNILQNDSEYFAATQSKEPERIALAAKQFTALRKLQKEVAAKEKATLGLVAECQHEMKQLGLLQKLPNSA